MTTTETTYVVRSMSTTDYRPGGDRVVPYHIYLMKPEARTGAYWNQGIYHAQRFASPQQAEAEAVRLKLANWDVAPFDHGAMPDFWELRDMSPETLAQAMRMWRNGWAPLPQLYVDLHEAAARRQLDGCLKRHELELVETRMVRDGWADGMRVLEVEALDFFNRTQLIRWSDSNGGSWFEQTKGGGWSLLEHVGCVRRV